MPSIATWIRQCDEHWFTLIFSRYPHLAVHNARLHPVDLSQMDGLMLTGGGDISASYLRQAIADASLIVDTDCARDEWEFKASREMLFFRKACSGDLSRFASVECRARRYVAYRYSRP